MLKALNNEKSIAVLPFENLSSDPENDYFSDGITEEIINALSQIPHLMVTARTSSFVFKNRKEDVRKIGRDLGVSLVMEGSVRKSGNRIRITAQLIRTEDGFQIWSEKFDRLLADIFELQDEISLLIAGKIREHYGHLAIKDRLVHATTEHIEAYQRYLKGLHYYNKWDLPSFKKAADLYQASIDVDPLFELPYFGAGLSYSFLGSWGGMKRTEAFRLAEDYFKRGSQLQSVSTYPYFSVAKHQFWGQWAFSEAYQTLLEVYKRQPEDAGTNEFLAEIYTLFGNFPLALQHIEKSISVDPLAPNHFYTKANIYYLQSKFEKALKVVREGLTLNPDFVILRELEVACLIHLKSPPKRLPKRAEETPLLTTIYDCMVGLGDKSRQTDPAVAEKVQEMIKHHQPPLLLAWDLYLLTHSGRIDEAMEQLGEKASMYMGPIINMKHDPFLRPLHHMKAYQELVARHVPGMELKAIEVVARAEKEPLSEEEVQHFTQLVLDKMTEEQYYLSTELSLGELAQNIDLHPNKLSWLLNHRLGKNFYDFVNAYRLKDFQERALDIRNRRLSLLGLAYESGFKSKSVFNDYFKKSTGMTPKGWLNKQIEG